MMANKTTITSARLTQRITPPFADVWLAARHDFLSEL